MKIFCYLVLTILLSPSAFAQEFESLAQEKMPALGKFFLGYNEGWFGPHYGSGLTSNFDADYVDEVFKGIKEAGGSVARVWLFEKEQGLQFNRYAPQTRSIESRMLTNIGKMLEIARKRKIYVYLTLFDGNYMPGGKGALRDYYYNLLNNKYGEGDAFRKNVLKPVLQVLNKNRDVIFGMDLMNEIEATIVRFYWPHVIHSPRAWMRTMRDYIRGYSPWLKVTTSSGWDMSYLTIPTGFFSGLGLDFYDMHLYADNGLEIFSVGHICKRAHSDGVPIILGEFGQLTKIQDDWLQEVTTKMFLSFATNNCFAGALAWRFDKSENWWNYQRPDGSLRPAARVIQGFKKPSDDPDSLASE